MKANNMTRTASQQDKDYQDYLNYLKRNDPTRTPMTREEFAEEYDAEGSAELGTADPMHY